MNSETDSDCAQYAYEKENRNEREDTHETQLDSLSKQYFALAEDCGYVVY